MEISKNVILKDMGLIVKETRKKLLDFSHEDIQLSDSFKKAFSSYISRAGNEIVFERTTAIITNSSGQKIYAPNQWFIIASYAVPLAKEVMRYREFSEAFIDKCILEIPKSLQKEIKEKKDVYQLMRSGEEKKKERKLLESILKQRFFEEYLNNGYEKVIATSNTNYLIRFMKDSKWWLGGKGIERTNDYFVSPILGVLNLVNASQSYVANMTYAYVTNKEIYDTLSTMVVSEAVKIENIAQVDELTPEWFRTKAKELVGFEERIQPLYDEFKKKFAPEKLAELSGKEVLCNIFLNPYNKENVCRVMEYDNDNHLYFGSIKSGTAFKYGLFYSPKVRSWVTGTSQNPEYIDEETAIEIGTEMRDYLLAGVKVLSTYESIENGDAFNRVYEELLEATGGHIRRIWFLKYYHMIFPNLLPTIYSDTAQNTALETIGKKPETTLFGRIGQIEMFVNECGISNAMFNHLMWHYAVNENISEEGSLEDKYLKSCLEIVREPRTNKVHPINFIVYGAPGTGKTYSMVEYALAIVENVPVEEFRENNKNRKDNVARYKDLVRTGQIVFTTFHQNYGYEEFIQGLRPDKDSETMAFKTVDGVFKTIADTALNDTEGKNYIIIIDEINRANISKVFGELITLIEEDKRWGELNETSATLQSGDPFAVPNNLYIVGTMNSADKSISLIDAALRRRFDFIEQKPDSSLVADPVLKIIIETINLSLVEELDSTDLLVGHSYFMNKTEKDLCNILNNNIIPLLYEYFYDNRKKIASLLAEAIKKAEAKVEIVDEKVGRLRVKDV